MAAFVLLSLLAVLASTQPALAQVLDLGKVLEPGSGTTSGRIIQMLLAVTVLSVAPGLLMTVTCFPRFVIALSFLRTGLGLQTTPSNLILINLALFMTWFIMEPTFDKAWTNGMKPLMSEQITVDQAIPQLVQPFKDFMRSNVREHDLTILQSFVEKTGTKGESSSTDELRTLVPAFMLSELRRGFEIGFLITLPFLVIDVIVASVVMSMGMMMVSPVVFSLPLKILFFVLIDGWSILVAGLIRSYA